MKKIFLFAMLILVFASCSRMTEDLPNETTRSFSRSRSVNYDRTARPRMNNSQVSVAPQKSNAKGQNYLAHYETEFDTKDTNRGTNISIATRSINGTVVNPGEEFSFNDTIGSTTAEYGYKESVVYVGGKKARNFGGGVCQVSTTLCNAAINAGMTITERHDHSLPVNYVPNGKEAATSHNGDLDFKFINERNHPVRILADVQNGIISVGIVAV
jgi:vancomycin resistance protein YoaR